MSEKAKILLLSTAYLPYVGGSELAIKNVTQRINNLEFDLITARLDKNVPSEEMIGNVSVFRVGGFLTLSSLFLPKNLLPLAIFLKARSLLSKNDYKLVHVFQASGAAGAAWLLKLFYPRIKFVLTLQEGKNFKAQGFLINFFRKLIIRKADYVTAISNYLKSYVASVKSDIPVELIPNGVDIENFSRDFSYGELTDLEEKIGIKPDDKVIISAGRLAPKNGLDCLIKALAILNKNTAGQYKLVLPGIGPEKINLEKLAEMVGVGDKVIFVGHVNYKDLAPYLKISDVFVRPSRSEGLGNAFLEAMAAGIPIIGTKVGGIPDFLEDRKTGLFCSLEPSDIAVKINIILENEVLRQEIIKNGRALVSQKYDWDEIVEKYVELYRRFKV